MAHTDPQRGKRIAIAGAGPGGLSAGLALHRAGFDVTVFERHRSTQALGGAILLNAIGMYILRSYGADISDLHTFATTELRRYDGHPRVAWQADPALVARAGAPGWMSGTMRSEVYARMIEVAPEGMIVNGKEIVGYAETADEVTLRFTDGTTHTADLLIAADGIESVIREQLWGPAELKHLGIVVYLGWSKLPDRPHTGQVVHHDDKHQLGYAPLNYRGEKCMEWWFVEAVGENDPAPADPKSYVLGKIQKFQSPVPEMVAATDPEHGLFRWIVKYKEPLPQWSRGRVTLLGDAAHPTSPYAGYGAGMAIEDGFFLGKFLAGKDLSSRAQLDEALARYDDARVAYTNKTTAFARTMGRVFHGAPWIGRKVRDFVFDHTRIPDKQISKAYTEDAQLLLKSILAADGVS